MVYYGIYSIGKEVQILNYSVAIRILFDLIVIAGSSTSIPTTMASQRHRFFSFETSTRAARAPALTATPPPVSTYYNSLASML